jgi:hypothetical protein
VKISLVIFLGTSLAMCGTLSNLGLIIRQKTMIMYFFLFFVIAFLDYKKGIRAARRARAVQSVNQNAQLAILSR